MRKGLYYLFIDQLIVRSKSAEFKVQVDLGKSDLLTAIDPGETA
jgi:hypothetical protein